MTMTVRKQLQELFYHKKKLRNKARVDNYNSTVVNPETNANDKQEIKVADKNEIKVKTHNATQVATVKSHTVDGNQVETNPFEIDQENNVIIYTTCTK